jgi:hypothetical protein
LIIKNPFTTCIAKKCVDKDYTLDFMGKSKKEKLMELYSIGFKILPTTGVKCLKIIMEKKTIEYVEKKNIRNCLGKMESKSRRYPKRRKIESVFEKVTASRYRFFSKKELMPIYTNKNQTKEY